MIDMSREGKTLQSADLNIMARLTATARARGWKPHGRPFDSVLEPVQYLQPV